MKPFIKVIILLLVIAQACGKRNVSPTKNSFFNGTFKAKEVKEGNTIVYKEGTTNNIIPGYKNYRITFSVLTSGRRNVKLTEYSGEVFEGTWNYDEATNILSFTNLLPRPAAGTFAFVVDTAEEGLIVLTNSSPNPKTGDTINQYTLIPE